MLSLSPASQLIPAAEYLRMSTDHQQYSIANQAAVIALYAAAHGLAIVRSFTDAGKTGRTIKHRQGLQDLLGMVESKNADFKHVLVYDVSRWGRFPDADEAAHYEYLCKQAGISVRYCAEQFENDNSPTSNLLKALKRTMASEFSRELSVKVSAGQRRLVSMGFWQGGNGPFGYQRLLVSSDGKPKHLLKFREWKSIDSDRIKLVPGPRIAVETIRLAYDLYTKKRKSRSQIVEILNKRGFFLGKGPWNLTKVRCLLQNPIYKGAYAYGKHDHKYLVLPREKWLVRENAFPAIVPPKQWEKAFSMVHEEIRDYENAEMLDALRKLWKEKGTLTTKIINYAKGVPSTEAYRNHFGGVNEVYRIIGYPITRDLTYIHAIMLSRKLRDDLCEEILQRVWAVGGIATKAIAPGLIRINGTVTVKAAVRKGNIFEGSLSWQLPIYKRDTADILVIGRLKPPERKVFDYFIIPAYSELHGDLRSRLNESVAFLELYHHKTLDSFIELFRPYSIRGAA